MTGDEQDCDCGGHCPATTSVDRRRFLQLAGSIAALPALSSLPVMAGPFDDNVYLRIISADKKLDPAWLRSLYERGVKKTYTDPKDLSRIGMPVGGLFTGTVYLSGDGRLWL
jgi:non-lysosomal glucosylceramidase